MVPYGALANPQIPREWAETKHLPLDLQLAILTTTGYLSIAPDADLASVSDETMVPLVVPNDDARYGLKIIGEEAFWVPAVFSSETVRTLFEKDDVLGVVDLALRSGALALQIGGRYSRDLVYSKASKSQIRDRLATLIEACTPPGLSLQIEEGVPQIGGTESLVEELEAIRAQVTEWD